MTIHLPKVLEASILAAEYVMRVRADTDTRTDVGLGLLIAWNIVGSPLRNETIPFAFKIAPSPPAPY